jgi:hypothetical protein
MTQSTIVEALDNLGRIRAKLAAVQQSLLPVGADQVANGQALILAEIDTEIAEVEGWLQEPTEQPAILAPISTN